MALNVMSLQALPGVRDYRLNVAVRKVDPDIRFAVVIETRDYNRVFETLGHRFGPIHVWRERPKATWTDKIYYHFLSEKTAGRRLGDLADELNVDVIHTHNYDHLAYYALKYTKRPVVHDVSDFYSLFPRNYQDPSARILNPWKIYYHWRRLRYEKFAFENSHGLTFNSPQMLNAAKQRYNIGGRALVIPNAVPQSDLPGWHLPKVSAQDGEVHTVFVGHINRPELDRLKKLADRGVHVHLYFLATKSTEPILLHECVDHPYVHQHGSLSYRTLLQQLTQYDYGLALWYGGADEEFFQVTLPSKLFDYLGSGLPVIVGPYPAMVDFVQAKGCGFVLRDMDQLEVKLACRYPLGDPREYTMEYYVPALVDLYREMA